MQIGKTIRKENAKYMLQHVAPPGSCQMDIMYNSYKGRNATVTVAYLVLINIGTRKAYYCEINPHGAEKKSVEAIKPALEKVLKEAEKDFHVTFLRTDSEAAFQSKEITNFLIEKGIVPEVVPIIEGRATHTALAVVDRVIRTLRDIAGFQLFEANIRPEVMAKAVDNYNKSPHSTLQKKLHKKGISPNTMTSRDEEKMREKIVAENQETQGRPGYKLPIGTEVRVHRQQKIDSFNKNDRFPFIPTNCRVTGREGAYYFVSDGKKTYKVSRFYLDPK
jgi:hypothetical protein